MGQKVTGKKSELIDRLMTQHHNIPSDDSTTTNGIEDISEKISLDASVEQLPEPLQQALIKYSSSSATYSSAAKMDPKLLPVQQKSYQIIADGNDAVIFSPTGTGKTLAYTIPLASRLWDWKHDGSLSHQKKSQKQRFMKQRSRQQNGNDSMPDQVVDVATPSILILEPSRELARQVGKVWGKFHPTASKGSKKHVVTVYGGVPVARQAALLTSKADVVIGTPGRIRELIREKHLSTSHIRSIVLDEADTLLNFKDNPEVDWLLEGMQNDYQLVLASATINERVEKFVGEVMELEVGEEGYVVVDARDDDGDTAVDEFEGGGIDVGGDDGIGFSDDGGKQSSPKSSTKKPVVNHWSMPATAASRVALTSDLIVTASPRRGIVFVPSKAEVENVAGALAEKLSSANDASIHILHGDMVQAARSRTINSFRGDTSQMTRILVATDVAARGLDLPAVDLVLQYGVPREAGKDGTFDSELYIHRTGRAGRFGTARSADAILLYDTSQGERTTLMKLQEEMKELQGVEISPRQLPSPAEVMEASYNRAALRCEEFGRRLQSEDTGDGTQSLVQYFVDKLTKDEGFVIDGTNDKESQLVIRLATSMAALSGLDAIVPPRSLLTANPKDRTIQVWNDKTPLSPPEVTKVVKALGSGKLGRISICDDGSAVFDLGAVKAKQLLQNVADDADLKSSGWRFEMPTTLT